MVAGPAAAGDGPPPGRAPARTGAGSSVIRRRSPVIGTPPRAPPHHSERLRYASGTDPTAADPRPSIRTALACDTGRDRLGVSFPHPSGVPVPGKESVLVRLPDPRPQLVGGEPEVAHHEGDRAPLQNATAAPADTDPGVGA